MNDFQFNDYEELLKMLGYCSGPKSNCDKNDENSSSDKNFYENINCNDMNGGFQKIYPQLLVVVGEIIGNVVARQLPINIQDALGNWLQLVGQVILTFNAQQQYYQSGPGRYFDERNYNINNVFCNTSQSQDTSDSGDGINLNNRNDIRDSKEKELKKEIYRLKKSIDEIKREIDKIKGC